MNRHPEVTDLLEQYMEASGSTACWVTVRDIRAHFNLDESIAPALSGFLQKIYQGPYFTCQYKVTRIEKFQDSIPPYRTISKYLVQQRPVLKKRLEGIKNPKALQKNQ
jgi:hypothetical protein